jgi:hypothetical protein
MMSEKHEKVEHDEKRPKPKRQPKRDYRKPVLTKFGPVEEFTGNGVS